MLYNVVLVSTIQKCESAISIYIYIYSFPLESPFPAPSHPYRSSQSTWLSSLGYTANSHQLAILHMITYTVQCYSFNLSHLLLPLLCPQVHSRCLRLYSCPANRFIRTIFHIYELTYDICFDLLVYCSLFIYFRM